LTLDASGDIILNSSTNSINLQNNGSTQYGSFSGDTSGNFTITSGTGEDVTSGVAGNLTLDASGDIILNSSTNSINLQNDGTTFGTFSTPGSNNLTIAGTGGNVYINGDLSVGSDGNGTGGSSAIGSINLYDPSGQYGSFTGDTSNNLIIQADGNGLDGGNLFLNAPNTIANESLTTGSIGIGLGTMGNNLGLFVDKNGLLHIQSNNSYYIDGGSITLASDSISLTSSGTTTQYGSFTAGNTAIPGQGSNDLVINAGSGGNILLNAGDHINIAYNDNTYCYLAEVTDANGNQTGASINAYSTTGATYMNLSISTYGNGGNINLDASGGSINLLDGTTQYGSFSGDATGNFTIDAGSGGNVYIENNLTVGSSGGGTYYTTTAGSINLYDGSTQYGSFYSDASGDLNISPSGGGNLNLELGTSGWYVSLGDISNNTIPNNIPSNAKLSLNYTSSTMYISAPNDLVMESLGSVTLVSETTPTFDFNNTNGTNGTFLSISQDENSNVHITTASAPLSTSTNTITNLSITALGSMVLNSGDTYSISLQNGGTTFGTFSTPGSNNLTIAAGTGNNVYIENNLTVGSNTTANGTIYAGSIDLYGGTNQYAQFYGNTSNNLTIYSNGGTVYTNNNLSVGSGGGGTITAGEINGSSLSISGTTATINGSDIVTQSTLSNTLSDYYNFSSSNTFTVPFSTSTVYINLTKVGSYLLSVQQSPNVDTSTLQYLNYSNGGSYNIDIKGIGNGQPGISISGAQITITNYFTPFDGAGTIFLLYLG
jgi:hypothetical protein